MERYIDIMVRYIEIYRYVRFLDFQAFQMWGRNIVENSPSFVLTFEPGIPEIPT